MDQDIVTEYRDWIERNRPEAPPSELPYDREVLKNMVEQWEGYENALNEKRRYDVHWLHNLYGGVEEMNMARVHIKNIKTHINNLKKKRLENERSKIKAASLIPMKWPFHILHYNVIKEMIQTINSRLVAPEVIEVVIENSPGSDVSTFVVRANIDDKLVELGRTETIEDPLLEASSVREHTLSEKEKREWIKKNSIAKNLDKNILIEKIIAQSDPDDIIETTIQRLEGRVVKEAINFIKNLGYGEKEFAGKLSLPEKRAMILVIFNKLKQSNPKEMPFRAAVKIEEYVGTRVAARKKKNSKTRKL